MQHHKKLRSTHLYHSRKISPLCFFIARMPPRLPTGNVGTGPGTLFFFQKLYAQLRQKISRPPITATRVKIIVNRSPRETLAN